MENKIKGFKAFNKGLITRYGDCFEIGRTYCVEGPIIYAKNGFHFCKRPEDTLRYVDGFNNDIEIARVVGSGDVVSSFDDYYAYYDLYASSLIDVVSVMGRNELIDCVLDNGDIRRLITGLRLTDDEIKYIIDNYSGSVSLLLRYIDYYQKGDKNAFTKVRY